MKRSLISVLILICSTIILQAQNPLAIPPTLSGTDFQLNVQSGTQSFFSGWNTPTYGVNGSFLAPTLLFNKGDVVNLHVTNNLTVGTTMHWHGLHVPAKYDGGPHQSIAAGTTWDVSFKVLNDAATYWYHPHGEGKTDLQVSKGLAGLIIVTDSNEASLDLPRTYGTDDFPLIVQTKAFDQLYQIAIATEMDTAVFVNGTIHPYLDAPSQVVRLRLLNGSSMRSYYFGFSNNMTFYQIGTDGGLLEAPVPLTRLRLTPGERAEVLVDLATLEGQTIFLKSFSSGLSDGIYGAQTVGNGMMSITGYDENPLNGSDFNILQINVVAPTLNAVTTIPSMLNTVTPISVSAANLTRTFTFAPQNMMPMDQMVEGPFTINGVQFNMEVNNVTTYLNNTEIWKLTNQTMVAHPFHIHDVDFYILDENGNSIPPNEQGKKDVVLVMPMQTVNIIMKFSDFADDSIPYMYHCHLLHHEDDGMMGSFVVLDTAAIGIQQLKTENWIHAFPNPIMNGSMTITLFKDKREITEYTLFNILGQHLINEHLCAEDDLIKINFDTIPAGTYFLKVVYGSQASTVKIIKQ